MMKKEYLKPIAEYVNLYSEEKITKVMAVSDYDGDLGAGGSVGIGGDIGDDET